MSRLLNNFADFLWSTPVFILILGGGLFFVLYSRLVPYRLFFHGLAILSGRHREENARGDLSHFQALASALSGTIGMGNIAGVAVAVSLGGPGALFWMWVSALIGMATKFFTCTLSVMFRGPDARGHLQGGPMYFIRHGLGEKYLPLAKGFAIAGVIGCAPLFVSSQLSSLLVNQARDLFPENHLAAKFLAGLILALLSAPVILGGLKRIARVAEMAVPLMVLVYLGSGLLILILNAEKIPDLFRLIFREAFRFEAGAGGIAGGALLTGIRRGTFSNEAGIGTEAMAHGNAKTGYPIREGLVAMLGPFFDTILVCSVTGFVILLSGFPTHQATGVLLAKAAFAFALPAGNAGEIILTGCAFIFGITTIFTYSYYGGKCLNFLINDVKRDYFRVYDWFYLVFLVIGASFEAVAMVSILDIFFACMAFPTMIASLRLSPVVMAAAREYLENLSRLHPE